ncbi:hypothetical protein [Pseudomonas rubra]|uniref:Uncharacterized protein n=1 Tax=Pseudomonas rubra TaxID=2942627 RepID=A0ABT5PF61_9PSED|nr:hypothetical protein [Pseudomonas rubra]MDD1016951.1 hypothetical protein [Pseudomonas rubra]MDD1041052.1 hypothetical protein [Pseudomonas rubra]MDD1157479.1 hypothetical protein [Pseudomonas rubra]
MKVLNTEMSKQRLATLVVLVVLFTALENYAYAEAGPVWAAVFFIAGTASVFFAVPRKIYSSIEA